MRGASSDLAPVELINSWTVQDMPRPMWRQRAKSDGIASNEAFLWASFRAGLTADSTFLLLKGFNGNYRNPYQTFVVHTLRLGGDPLLNGFKNGVVTKINGVLDNHVPQDAGLTTTGLIGSTVLADAYVPNMTGSNWSRTLLIHDDRYMISIDKFDITTAASDFTVETYWDPNRGEWDDTRDLLEITATVDAAEPSNTYHLRSSAPVTVRSHAHDEVRESVSGEELDSEYILSVKRSVEPGDRFVNFHSIAPAHHDGTSQQISTNAAVLSLPEDALVIAGSYRSTTGTAAVISTTHVIGHDVTQVGLMSPLLTSSRPIDIEWNFQTATLELHCHDPVKIQLSPEYVETPPAQNPEIAVESREFELPASTHELSDIHPSQRFLDEFRKEIARSKTSPRPESTTHSNTALTSQQTLAPLNTHFSTSLHDRCEAIAIVRKGNEQLLAVSAGGSVHLIDQTGTTVHRLSGSATVQELHWWDSQNILLVGREDATVSAFTLDRDEPVWTFASQMAPAVKERGKEYWYRSAPGHGGIHGISSGQFLGQSEQAFVGSACTVEILNESGSLLERKPVFWGPVHAFETIQKTTDVKRLLMLQRPTDSPTVAYLDSDTRSVEHGYDSLPPDHTTIHSWGVSARQHLVVADCGDDGNDVVISDTTGKWNQVSTWTSQGDPRSNVHLGPGNPTSFHIHTPAEADAAERARYIRSMESLRDGAGNRLFVVGTNARSLVGLSGRCDVEWVSELPSVPTTISSMTVSEGKVVIGVGCDTGDVLAVDSNGVPFAQTHQSEPPAFSETVWGNLVTVARSGTVTSLCIPN